MPHRQIPPNLPPGEIFNQEQQIEAEHRQMARAQQDTEEGRIGETDVIGTDVVRRAPARTAAPATAVPSTPAALPPPTQQLPAQRLPAALGVGGGGGGGGGGAFPTLDILPTRQMELELQAMHERYLLARLDELEIPEMRNRDERERIALALQAAQQFAEQAGYVVPFQSFLEFTQTEGTAVTQETINDLRSRLQATGRDEFTALAQLGDDELVRHVLNDETLFVGDPIREALKGSPASTGLGVPGADAFPFTDVRIPTLERQKFMAQLARDPGDYMIYQALLRGQPIPGLETPEIIGGIRRNIPLPEIPGVTPAPGPNEVRAFGGQVDPSLPFALGQTQAGEGLGLAGPPALTSDPALGGVRPRGAQAIANTTPQEEAFHQGIVSMTGEPVADRLAFENTLLRRLGTGFGTPSFGGIGVR